jgi:acyl-CoA thioester hydrolase
MRVGIEYIILGGAVAQNSEVHHHQLRVYYEDTDMAGIVYYANYLKYIERARSEWVRTLGIDQLRLREEEGVVFAVRRVEADYLASAKFDDVLNVQTQMISSSAARITLEQTVWRADKQLFTAEVILVAINREGQPTRLPDVLRRNVH